MLSSIRDIKTVHFTYADKWGGKQYDVSLDRERTLNFLISCNSMYKEISFEFAGMKWLAIGNADRSQGVRLCAADGSREVRVEFHEEPAEFSYNIRVGLRKLLYDFGEPGRYFLHKDALVPFM